MPGLDAIPVRESVLADTTSRIVTAYALLQRHDVQASFTLEEVRMVNVHEAMHIFRIIDVGNAGIITKEQIKHGCKFDHTIRMILDKYEDTPLGLLKNERLVSDVMKQIKDSKINHVNKKEWKNFIGLIIIQDLEYLRVAGLIALRCYWGRGLNEPVDYHDAIGSELLHSHTGCYATCTSYLTNHVFRSTSTNLLIKYNMLLQVHM